jgi:hypothetical protein
LSRRRLEHAMHNRSSARTGARRPRLDDLIEPLEHRGYWEEQACWSTTRTTPSRSRRRVSLPPGSTPEADQVHRRQGPDRTHRPSGPAGLLQQAVCGADGTRRMFERFSQVAEASVSRRLPA